jgi:L-2-hydroxyglutarate oxidase
VFLSQYRSESDMLIIGGGIVGLATAWQVRMTFPELRVVLLEKEGSEALHQSGRNSGVIHSGIYYPPGSAKAQYSQLGREKLLSRCRDWKVPYEVCGKLIVATRTTELRGLEKLFQRGLEHGLKVEFWDQDKIKTREPFISALKAIYVPETGIVDFKDLCRKLVEKLDYSKEVVHFNTRVEGVKFENEKVILDTNQGKFRTGFVINCAGIQNDRVAKLFGVKLSHKIIPFKGEYFELSKERQNLIRHLVYPVPDEKFPFLGIHFTRMIDGHIHVGPNAVFSFKREGYSKLSFSLGDSLESLMYPGFQKFALRHFSFGLGEISRSLIKRLFVKKASAMLPGLNSEDLVWSKPGIRAQCIAEDGKPIQDFLFVNGENSLHVCNAPSPAATCSLQIADEIIGKIKV